MVAFLGLMMDRFRPLGLFRLYSLLKYSIIISAFVAFSVFIQACSCGKLGDNPNPNLTPADSSSENNDQSSDLGDPVDKDDPIDKDLGLSVENQTAYLTPVINSADGFVPAIPKLTMKMTKFQFDETKVKSAEKPCEAAITFSVKNLITGAPATLDEPGSVTCIYVDQNTIDLSITPPNIRTAGNDLGVTISRQAALRTEDIEAISSENPAIELTLNIKVDDTYAKGLTANAEIINKIQLKSKGIGLYRTDPSQLVADYKSYSFLFNGKIAVMDVKNPSKFFLVKSKYVSSFENSWVGLKHPSVPAYYIFERSKNNNDDRGYFHLHALSLNRIANDLDFAEGTGTINSSSWSTAKDLGGTMRPLRSIRGVTPGKGVYINHKAPFFIGGNGNLIGFDGGYSHHTRPQAATGLPLYSIRTPILRSIRTMDTYNFVPTKAAGIDAAHDIFTVVPGSTVYLKVGRYTKPYIQQFNYVDLALATSYRDVTLSGETPDDATFENGNRALRIVDGNVYVYVLGGTQPIVGTVTVAGTTITDFKIEHIDNPLGNGVSLNLPYLLYNSEEDVLLAYIPGHGTSENTATKIFIGRFDNANDSTPTWTRYF